MYIHTYICINVCVCVREREREKCGRHYGLIGWANSLFLLASFLSSSIFVSFRSFLAFSPSFKNIFLIKVWAILKFLTSVFLHRWISGGDNNNNNYYYYYNYNYYYYYNSGFRFVRWWVCFYLMTSVVWYKCSRRFDRTCCSCLQSILKLEELWPSERLVNFFLSRIYGVTSQNNKYG
jgi:hypothetical protein